jgi:uncharacterized hydrophobic protein (TIGR00341 family)
MSLRILQVAVAEDLAAATGEILDALEEPAPLDRMSWNCDGRVRFELLLEARDTEAVMDVLGDKLGSAEGFRLVVLPVEATVPRPEEKEEAVEKPAEAAGASRPDRVSREELYADLTPATRASRMFFAQVALATLVAAVGLITGSTAVTIGAMVLAPLLGPNVALAFGATLGDLRFVRRALAANLSGLALALVLSTAAGAIVAFDPTVPTIASRTALSLSDIALALAAGAAGTLAMLSAVSTALVGVMVAVALLPPLVVTGLLFGTGEWSLAFQAALLLAANVICVNLAGVITFLLMGVRPRDWWEQAEARRSSRIALIVWAVLLTALLALLLMTRQG